MEAQDFDQELADLEVSLERLRALYEQYFLGIERIEPSIARKSVDRRFWQLKRVKVRNTARRFRMQMLVQRYNTLQQYWAKVCRQIENGTYVRHVQRARRRWGEEREQVRNRAQPAVAPPATAADEPAISATQDGMRQRNFADPPTSSHSAVHSATKPSAKRISLAPLSPEARERVRSSAPPAPARRPRNATQRPAQKGDAMTGSHSAGWGDGISDERVGGLYQELQRVRRRLNQDEIDVSVDALTRSLRATEARLKEKYKGKRVDFRVEVHDGKAVIKPTVKR